MEASIEFRINSEDIEWIYSKDDEHIRNKDYERIMKLIDVK